jgi:diguanylate cyclase (GGDEF)-like protein
LNGADLEAKYRAAIDYLGDHDALTRVRNEPSWRVETERRVLYARGVNRPLSALLIEIDRMESLRGRAGTPAYNGALLRVSQVLRQELGQGAIAGRLASDRFGVVLPGADLEQALTVAERLRCAISARPLRCGGETWNMTVGRWPTERPVALE